MPRARLVFDGDGVYTEKEARIHKLTEETETKIDNIPGIVDDVNSDSTTDALSAHMGKVLQNQINNLAGVGTFLSNWDCTTGLPESDPQVDPYTYKAGNYYIVSKVADLGGTNYKPHGATYTQGVASTTIETGNISMNDWYIYDGAQWLIQPAGNRTIVIDDALSPTSRNAVENRAVYSALSQKQTVIFDLGTIREGAAAGATALQPGDNITELTNNAGYQTAGDVAAAIEALAPHGVGEGVLTLQKNSSTIDTFSANASQDKTINITVPTTVAELTDANDYATKTYVDEATDSKIHSGPTAPTPATTGMLWYDTVNNILKVYNGTSWVAVDTDTTYTAGTNVQINGTVISATDTTYTASDFDIKDLTDSTNLRTTWSGKQDAFHTISSSAPVNPSEGDEWYDTTEGKIKVYDGTEWKKVGGEGNMYYSDFNFANRSGTTVTLDIASKITPSANFTVNAPSDIKDGQAYILRVTNGATVYTMTLGTNITNPYNTNTDLTPNGIDQFIFLAVGGKLELQPDSINVSNAPYSSDWVGNTAQAPSKNAVYNKINNIESQITVISSGASLGAYFKAAQDYGTLHTIDVSSGYTYTMKGMGYIRVHWFYGYAVSINGLDVFNYTFDSGSYVETRFLGPYTASAGDVVRIYRPGASGGISATIYDYYDDTIPITTPGIYYSSSQQLISMSTDGLNWFSIADRDLGGSPDSRGSLYSWGNSGTGNEDWEQEIAAKPGYRVLTENDYMTMRNIYETLYPGAYDFRPTIHMTTSASQYSDTSDNTFYWTSNTNTSGVAYIRNLPSYSSELPEHDVGSDGYTANYGHPVRPVKIVPVQPTLSWDVIYQPSS